MQVVVLSTMIMSAFATFQDASWTAWFGAQTDAYQSGSKSADRTYPIMGAHCAWHWCGSLRFYQYRQGSVPTMNDGEWTDWISEETGGSKNNTVSCSTGKVVTQAECRGHWCDEKRLRCSTIDSNMELGTPVWNDEMFSEESRPNEGQASFCDIPNGVVVGWQCKHEKCDNNRLQCASLTRKNWTASVPADTYSWTAWFSEEQTYSEDRPYPITRMRCSGPYCDNLKLWQGKSGHPLLLGTQWSQWTQTFSSDSDMRCPINQVVTRIQCSGDDCSSLNLQCAPIDTSVMVMGDAEFQSISFSDEGNSLGFCRPDQYYVTGMRCFNDRCDMKYLYCKKVTRRGELVPYDTTPVGYWQFVTQFQKVNPSSWTIERCTQSESSTGSHQEQTQAFASSVEASFSVEYEASTIFAKASTTYGMAVSASTELASSVSREISETKGWSTCVTSVVQPDNDTWAEVNARVPQANLVDLYQWRVSRQTYGSEPGIHFKGTYALVPEGMGKPVCPPRFQTLGDQFYQPPCLNGTFVNSTSVSQTRRLLRAKGLDSTDVDQTATHDEAVPSQATAFLV